MSDKPSHQKRPGRSVQLDLPLLLPDAPDERDECVQRVMRLVDERKGVLESHIETSSEGASRLCVHYDPDITSLEAVERLTRAAGAEVTQRYGHAVLSIDGVNGQRRGNVMEELLRREPGVLMASANAAGESVRVEFDRTLTSLEAIESFLKRQHVGVRPNGASIAHREAGHQHAEGERSHAVGGDAADHGHAHGSGWFGKYGEMLFALSCGVLLLAGWLVDRLTDADAGVVLGLYIAAYFLGGFFTTRDAIDGIRAKRFEIDTLMLVAAVGAAALGEWAEGALLLFLFSLGHSLEHYAMGKARREIEALGKLAPKTARVTRDGVESEVPIERLIVGDVISVRPGDRIAADGEVIKGTSSVDQAPITGESMPITKGSDEGMDRVVFAGTINGEGSLNVRVSKLASESTLARVVRMVREAETQKSPTQKLTDRIERVFVPSVLILGAALLVVPPLLMDEEFAVSFYRAMSVLVAASPCALAIATPSAVLSGVARAARGGVLIKGGLHLENLGGVTAIAMDKTGTLTEGKPKVTDVTPFDGTTDDELLRLTSVVERQSSHPLALAIVRAAEERKLDLTAEASEIRNVVGKGIASTIDGREIAIGKPELFADSGTAVPSEILQKLDKLQSQGRSTVTVRFGDKYLGIIGLMDTPRESAKGIIDRLHELGVDTIIMLSGDNQRVADAVARAIGIDEARGNLLPEQKVEVIKELAATRKVAMLGDGVNDAPALAHATVGIAMGASGSDVALETADVALMADDLSKLPFAVGLSRKASSIIKQNMFASLGMVVFLIPATLFGFAGIGLAVALHEGSTIAVVINALRLLAYEDKASSPKPLGGRLK